MAWASDINLRYRKVTHLLSDACKCIRTEEFSISVVVMRVCSGDR